MTNKQKEKIETITSELYDLMHSLNDLSAEVKQNKDANALQDASNNVYGAIEHLEKIV